MRTKKAYVYWFGTRPLYLGAFIAKAPAVRSRALDMKSGYPVGPIVEVDLPLPDGAALAKEGK